MQIKKKYIYIYMSFAQVDVKLNSYTTYPKL